MITDSPEAGSSHLPEPTITLVLDGGNETSVTGAEESLVRMSQLPVDRGDLRTCRVGVCANGDSLNAEGGEEWNGGTGHSRNVALGHEGRMRLVKLVVELVT
jgi:hypothetical protein